MKRRHTGSLFRGSAHLGFIQHLLCARLFHGNSICSSGRKEPARNQMGSGTISLTGYVSMSKTLSSRDRL